MRFYVGLGAFLESANPRALERRFRATLATILDGIYAIEQPLAAPACPRTRLSE